MAETKKTTKAAPAPAAPQPEQKAVVALDWSVAGVTGFENVQARDLGIPFLVILQSGSPEVKKTHQRYEQAKIEGAVEGTIINTVTRKILHQPGEEPFEVIPLYWDKLFVEWKPRQGGSGGGGFVAVHRDELLLSKCRKNEKNQDVLPNGNILVTTAYFYVLYKDEEEVEIDKQLKQAIIGMSSTQLRASRQWLNMSQSLKVALPNGKKVTPPLFSHRYLVSSVPQNNDKGSWMGWKIEVSEMLTDPAEADAVISEVRNAKEFAQLNAPVDSRSEPDNEPM